jgi:hypothetical protein
MTEFKRRRKRDLSGMLEKPKDGAPITHGANSLEVQARYSDKRTKEGQRLAAVTKGLIADLGGAKNISTAQNIILGSIKGKLIVVFQLSNWADKQKSVVDNLTGELPPSLGKIFLQYTESLRRDLAAIQKLAKNKLPSDLYAKWQKQFLKDAKEPKK